MNKKEFYNLTQGDRITLVVKNANEGKLLTTSGHFFTEKDAEFIEEHKMIVVVQRFEVKKFFNRGLDFCGWCVDDHKKCATRMVFFFEDDAMTEREAHAAAESECKRLNELERKGEIA